MKVSKISMFLFLSFLIINCASEKALKSEKITKDGIEILYGDISKEQLFYDFPDWEKKYKNYEVNHSILASVRNFDSNLIEIDIFLGTWCGDSKREVPKFLKIVDEINLLPELKIKLFAVDLKKRLKSELAEKNDIQRVATFVFRRDSQEIGRIIEYPKKSLESDIVEILNNK